MKNFAKLIVLIFALASCKAPSGNTSTNNTTNDSTTTETTETNSKGGSENPSGETTENNSTDNTNANSNTAENNSNTEPQTNSTTNETPPLTGSSADDINKAIDQANYLTADEKEMVREINRIRTDPKGYVSVIEDHIKRVKANSDFFGVTTKEEEIATANETIAELKNLSPLNALMPHPKLQGVAKKHGNDLKNIGKIDTNSNPHQGSDGSMPHARISKLSEFVSGGENFVGGRDNVRDSVLELLIDAGIDGRGHRIAILAADWKFVACFKIGDISTSSGPVQNDNWVQNFSN